MFNKTEDKFCPLCDKELSIAIQDDIRIKKLLTCDVIADVKSLTTHFYTIDAALTVDPSEVFCFNKNIFHINYFEGIIYHLYKMEFDVKIDPLLSRKENISKLLRKYEMYKVFK